MRKPPMFGNMTNYFPVKFHNVQYFSAPQADWKQEDPTKPDFIKNKEEAEKVRPININGVEVLSDDRESGALNLVSGENITLSMNGNSIIISARNTGGGGGGSECDCPEYVEGEGIDIIDNEQGQKVIAIEPGSIDDEHIESVSADKITQDEGETLILNGGKANG